MVKEAWEESMIEKLQSFSSSSSSDSDNDNPFSCSEKATIYRLFGREKPVHKVLGGGKTADVFLWRNRKLSGGLLGFATAIWVLFELLEYHLLTLVCHCLIVSLVVLFMWSNGSKYIKGCSPHIREVYIPEEPVLQVALAIRIETNNALAVLHHIAFGKDLKKFLSAITGLWVLSVLGSCCNILTLLYMAFVLLHTVPVFYEKYEDEVDSFAEKALAGLKKQCSVIESNFSIMMSKGLKDKKAA